MQRSEEDQLKTYLGERTRERVLAGRTKRGATNWLRHLAPLFVALGRLFGGSLALMDRHHWESVQAHLRQTRMRELYGGFVYIISGEVP